MFLRVVRFLWIDWVERATTAVTATHIDIDAHRAAVAEATERATRAENVNRHNAHTIDRLEGDIAARKRELSDVLGQLERQIAVTNTWRERAATAEEESRPKRPKEELIPLGRNSNHHWIREVPLDVTEPYAAVIAEARARAKEISPDARVGRISRVPYGWWTAQVQVPVPDHEVAEYAWPQNQPWGQKRAL